jgi:hypothetical protein
MIKVVLLAGTLSVAAIASASEQTAAVAPRPVGTAVLAGRVVRADGPDRLPAARIIVTLDAGDGRGKRQTLSNDEGRFAFAQLPAGRYGLTASKVGWVTTHYGSPRPGLPPGARVAVADGARVNVEIPIVMGGVIAGRIVDDEGQPMLRTWPGLLQQRLVGDRKMLGRMPEQLVGSFERGVNDRGEFRLFGVPPGTYYIVVTPSIPTGARLTTSDEVRWAAQAQTGPTPAPGPIVGYAPVYYPGTTDPAAARPIVVGPGEVHEGLEIRVSYVAVARVEGIAQRPDGAPAAGATITLSERMPQTTLEGLSRSARTDASGRFVLQSVPPGDYRISARASSAQAAPAPPTGAAPIAAAPPPVLDLWGQMDVVIAGQDVGGLGITLAPASTISGRLTFIGTSLKPPPDLTTIRLQFIATAALATALTGTSSASATHNATVDADGVFRVAGLPPDRYNATASWPGMRGGDGTTGWWLTTVHVDGRDQGDRPIDVQPNQNVTNVTLGFGDRIGIVEGALTDGEGRAAAAYYVVAFPVERESWSTVSRRLPAPAQTGTDGRYRLVGLPAGEYFLAVVTEVGPEDRANPEFLAALVPAAIRIKVGAGQTLRSDLKIK